MTEASKIAVEKPVASWLGMAKLETQSVSFRGTDMILPKILWKLCVIAFNCGYSDAHSYLTRGVFSTMMTGNFVLLMVAAHDRDNSAMFDISLVIVSYVFFGAAFNMILIWYFKSWERAYTATMVCFLLGCLLCEALDTKFGAGTYYLTLKIFSGVNGNVCFWTTKTGLLVFLQTGNMFKSMEFGLKYLEGYKLGDPKVIGDNVSIMLLQVFFGLGAVCAAFLNQYLTSGKQLLPMVLISAFLIAAENRHYWYQKYRDCVNPHEVSDRSKTISVNSQL